MRSYLWTVVLCLVTATAFAQAIGNPDNAGRRPGAGDGAGIPGGPAAGGASTGMFAAIDTDGDGVISTKELKNAMKALRALDVDKDGNISRAEASAGVVAAAPGGGPNALPADAAQAVDEIMKNDKNGDGKLTANELPREMARNMQDVDANADNSLTRDELMAAAQKMQNQGQGGLAGGLNGPWPVGGGGGRNDSQTGGLFKRYDANGDGRLSANELPPDMTSALRNADKNGDQLIDPAEMHEFLARMGSGARGFGMGGPNGGQGGVNRPGRNGT